MNPATPASSVIAPGWRLELKFLGKLVWLLAHVVLGLAWAVYLKLLGSKARFRRDAIARRWLQQLMTILGIRVLVRGAPVSGGQLVVCNHVSWLDIPLLGASVCSRFVAKSEIRHWPVAGWYANAIGTFYLRRGAGGSKPLLERLGPHLAAGGSVVLFPEGTTTSGRHVLPFHARLFEAAVTAEVPVQPVALHYEHDGNGFDIAPFIGADDLVSHIFRLLRSPGLTAQLVFCPPLQPGDYADRRDLAKAAETAVAEALKPLAADSSGMVVPVGRCLPEPQLEPRAQGLGP